MMWWLTQHLITTTALAMAVAVVVRWRRFGPAVKHALWLVVVVKFITPPLVVWPWTPWPPIAAAETSVGAISIDDRDRDFNLSHQTAAAPADMLPSVMSVEPPPKSLFPSLTTVAVVVWCSGGGMLFLWRALQALRLWRQIRRGCPATGELVDHVTRAAAIMGIAPPRTRLVRDLAAPGIWSWFRPLLLWPQLLPPTISTTAVRCVVLHELAHIRRRDHVTAWLVQIGDVVWWWNPLYWLVRRELRENAEMACDAWVTALAPESRREYAETLLKFSQIVPAALSPRPAVSFRTHAKKTFTRRLTMIMDDSSRSHRTTRWAISAIALLTIVALPAWSPGKDKATTTTTSEGQPPIEIHVDRQGKIQMNGDGLTYLLSLKELNAPQPTRELHISVDLYAKNNAVVKIIDDFREMGFARHQMTVRRKGNPIRPQANVGQATLPKTGISVRVYPVADIVEGYNTTDLTNKVAFLEGNKPPFYQFDGLSPKVDFKPIIYAIIVHSGGQWEDEVTGGPGRITEDHKTRSLVIRQTNECHNRIEAVLAEIRRQRVEGAQAYVDYLSKPPMEPEVLEEEVAQPQLVTRVYAVADLLYDLPPEHDEATQDNGFKKITEAIKRDNPSFVAEYDLLIKTIQSKTGNDDWEKSDGRGAINAFETTASLVIRQTEEAHREIADLLSAMREKKLGRAFVTGDRAAIEKFAKNYRRPPQ